MVRGRKEVFVVPFSICPHHPSHSRSLSCAPLPLDRPQSYAYVVFDPSGGALPLPNDALLDETTGQLALPTEDDTLTDADIALRHALNQEEGGPLDPSCLRRFQTPSTRIL